MNKDIHKFLSALIAGRNKAAYTHLKTVVDKKIKQRIINNNTPVF